MIARGRSYSVMMTCVSFPLGRGNVLSGYAHVEPELKLTVLRNSAIRCRDCRSASPRGWSSHRAGRFCTCSGKLEFVYVAIRSSTFTI